MAKDQKKRPKVPPGDTQAQRRGAPLTTGLDARRLRQLSLIVSIAAIATYVQSLAGDFTYDDVPIVRDNAIIRSVQNIPQLFQTTYWGEGERYQDKSLFRPLTMVTYSLNYLIHQRSPGGYHLANILLHVLCSLLFFRLIGYLSRNLNLAGAAALLFAVHPIHTEAVAGIVGRAELLAFLGTLTCLQCYFLGTDETNNNPLRRGAWLLASVLGYGLGVYSKEGGAIAPAFIVLTELLLPDRRALLKLRLKAISTFAAYGAVLASYLVLRSHAVLSPVRSAEFSDLTTLQRVGTALQTCLDYARLLLVPGVLSADYPRGDMHVVMSLTEPRVILALLILAGGLALVLWSWKRAPMVAWGILFFLMSLFPVSNLAFPIYVMKAERFLYTPSAGFLVCTTGLLLYVMKRRDLTALFWPAIGLVTVLFALRTVTRNQDWKNNYTLATATFKTAPSTANFRTILFNWYREHGQDDLARQFMAGSGSGLLQTVSGIYNMANLELDAKHYPEAIRLYRQVLEQEPDNSSALNNLSRALDESGDLSEAVRVCEQLRRLRPDLPGPTVNLIHLYVRLNDFPGALPVVEEALKRFPGIDAVQWNAGVVYTKLGRTAEAQAAYDRAAKLNPEISRQDDIRVEF